MMLETLGAAVSQGAFTLTRVHPSAGYSKHEFACIPMTFVL